ncbi:magnesium and cobalt transport protein CorA [Luteimonas fraxinea]|uniref:Magnesium and cobalt transport protein CorA n=1 Tax=Luteimonas fraxinea TaxID=2901869 RepID=A0ABS8UII8_9GAMM|nr:magnesium and cobalt transport protein CorA [Luteimonas fraxinea]MCD9098539.1 magnesium and cobalt transport protein CorA [Luteimonas fraxinea]MCD9127272.1 magnesium and cobalt transport protein CorA [Luteimonas fraxinea]UHH10647.1 magnesium and cobalt transport protein CorA [Luteimonas fraxinea]
MQTPSDPVPAVAPETANPACVVNCAVYGSDGRKQNILLDDISDVLAIDDGSFVWIGLYEPGADVLAQLQEEFCLHDLAIEDAGKAHQRPKIEAYGDSLFIVANTAQAIDERIAYGETHIFLGARYLVTVRHGASLSYAPARQRIEREPELMAMGAPAALYAVLDAIVDNYLPIVDDFKTTLNALEQDIISEQFHRGIVIRLYQLKRELTYMRVAVTPLQDVLSQLVRSSSPLIPSEAKLYIRDVLDHSVRINETIDAIRDILGTALGVNQALVTLTQGEIVKKLGAWAALLAAPTLITSWYGMNFHDMPELDERYAYPLLIGGVAVVMVVLYRMFKKARWL